MIDFHQLSKKSNPVLGISVAFDTIMEPSSDSTSALAVRFLDGGGGGGILGFNTAEDFGTLPVFNLSPDISFSLFVSTV